MNWIISANEKVYNHSAAFEKWGFIDWSKKANYSLGDTVYIYCTRPLQKVMYKTKVEKVDMSFEDIVNDEMFWVKKEDYVNQSSNTFIRLKLIKKVDSETLSLEKLKTHGLKAAPQGPIKVKNELLEYIDNCFSEFNHEIIYPENDTQGLKEGGVMTTTINSFERNSKARRLCIDFYGVSCQVCGMNFEEVYGQMGRSYIHVHHVVPLHKIDAEYIVNPIKDLIPVCPNCHAMLHTKVEGELITISELKKKIKQQPSS